MSISELAHAIAAVIHKLTSQHEGCEETPKDGPNCIDSTAEKKDGDQAKS